jgi:hypothetical protein
MDTLQHTINLWLEDNYFLSTIKVRERDGFIWLDLRDFYGDEEAGLLPIGATIPEAQAALDDVLQSLIEN